MPEGHHRIDPETHEIHLRTEEGVVPLAAISQGTSAVVCWIGSLLQRLYETHGDLEDPLAAGALVLVDEIDAHMHPEWQRRLAGIFRQLFPNVQVIATTHSPLIAGSLRPGEILKVRKAPLRAEVDGVVRVQKLDDGTLELTLQPDPPKGHLGNPLPSRKYSLPASTTVPAVDDFVVAGEQLTEEDVQIIAEPIEDPIHDWRTDQILTSDLFDLKSAYNLEIEHALVRYTQLVSKFERTAEEEDELAEQAATLDVRLPSPLERKEAQKAFVLIRDAVMERTRDLPDDERERLLEEVQVQLIESETGSRRPQ